MRRVLKPLAQGRRNRTSRTPVTNEAIEVQPKTDTGAVTPPAPSFTGSPKDCVAPASADEVDAVDEVDEGPDGVKGQCTDTAHPEEANNLSAKENRPIRRTSAVASLLMLAVLAAPGAWFGYRLHQNQALDTARELTLSTARQGAINLTTIDYEHVDSDTQRILRSATGTFYNDFQGRALAFTDFIRKTQSRTEGKVTEAAVESVNGTEARVLVALSVTTTTAGGTPDDKPRSWRMRITVQKDGEGTMKISNVEFVP